MAATCCAAGAVTVATSASVRRASSQKNNNVAGVVGAPSTSARVAVAPSRRVVRASAVAEAVADKETSLADSLRPSSADCARTLVEIANTGTISTTCEDGFALGTFASYVIDKSGEIVLRMRADAVHTLNIARDARCSLYVQPASQPPGVLSRVTLIGTLERLDDAASDAASKRYNAIHGENVGVDASGASDEYYKLVVARVFYVGGLGSDKRAEVVSADDFAAAAADALCKDALAIVDAMNRDRYEDVVNFARVSLPDRGEPAEARMLWVDSLGFDVRVITAEGAVLDVRVPFPAPATTTQQALSSLTMQAQLIWEEEKQYQPVPVPREEPEEKESKD